MLRTFLAAAWTRPGRHTAGTDLKPAGERAQGPGGARNWAGSLASSGRCAVTREELGACSEPASPRLTLGNGDDCVS